MFCNRKIPKNTEKQEDIIHFWKMLNFERERETLDGAGAWMLEMGYFLTSLVVTVCFTMRL